MNANIYEESKDPEAIVTLKDILTIIFKGKWLIITTLVASLLSAGVYLFLKDDLYEISAKVLVKFGRENAPSPTMLTEGPAVLSQETRGINAEIEILWSRELIETVVVKLGLDQPKEPEVPKKLFAWLKYAVKKVKREMKAVIDRGMIAIGFKEAIKPRDEAVLEIAKALNVSSKKDSSVIDVKLLVPFKEDSSVILNTMLDEYLKRHLEAHKNPRVSEFFQDQTTHFATSLKAAEMALADFKAANDIIAIDEQKKLLLQKFVDSKAAMERISVELEEERIKASEIKKDLATEPAKSVTEEVVRRNPSLDLLRERYFQLSLEREKLLAKYHADHPLVQDVEDQIAKVNELMKSEAEGIKASTTTDTNDIYQHLRNSLFELSSAASASKGKLATVEKISQEYFKELKRLDAKEGVYKELERAVKVTEADYVYYKRKLEEARVADAMSLQGLSNVAVIEPAADPIMPLGMRKINILALAAAAGLIGGMGIAFLREFMDRSFNSPEDLSRRAALVALAAMPYTDTDRAKSGRGPDCSHEYRDLLSAVESAGVRSVAMTSLNPAEGTTTTALGLAEFAASQAGLRVLAVELNNLTPTFGATLALDGQGVSAIITAGASPASQIQEAGAFKVLAFGARSPQLKGPRLKSAAARIIAELSSDYDLLVFDLPPVSARYSDFTEAAAPIAAAVLIVEAGRTRQEAVTRFAGVIARSQVNLLGAVLTKRRYYIPDVIYRWL